MLVIALAGTALGAGITRAHMMRRHRPRLFFVDAHGKVYTLTDKRRLPTRGDLVSSNDQREQRTRLVSH
jgi:hypothetical protein